MAGPADPDAQLEELCRVLNYYGVGYIVFGSHVARLNGVPVETIDVDVVPATPRLTAATACSVYGASPGRV